MASTINKLRVLVIDDNRDAAKLMVEIIELVGNDAIAAFGGVEGVEIAQTWAPDVVLLDLTMPVLDGFQVAKRLRQSDVSRNAFIIAFSAMSDPETRARTAEDFDFYLSKPATVEKIVHAISIATKRGEPQSISILDVSNRQRGPSLEYRPEHSLPSAPDVPAHSQQA